MIWGFQSIGSLLSRVPFVFVLKFVDSLLSRGQIQLWHAPITKLSVRPTHPTTEGTLYQVKGSFGAALY